MIEMRRFVQYSGTLCLGAIGAGLVSDKKLRLPQWPTTTLPPSGSTLNVQPPNWKWASLALFSGVVYWKGPWLFADIAYATKRSVQTLSKGMREATTSILVRVGLLEEQLQETEQRLHARIISESQQVRDDIQTLQHSHDALAKTVDGIDRKVTRIETCTTAVPSWLKGSVSQSGFLAAGIKHPV